MRFALAAHPTFTAPVSVTVPGRGDDGATETYDFVVEYLRLTTDELAELFTANKPMRDALRDLVVGWRGLQTVDGADVPFNAEHLNTLLKIPHVIPRLWDTFAGYNSGAALKN
jgi:hypothetical protein